MFEHLQILHTLSVRRKPNTGAGRIPQLKAKSTTAG